MKRLSYPVAAAAILLSAAFLFSCDKDNPSAPNKSNPTEYTLKGRDFDIRVEDCEHGFSKDSNYVFEGVFRDGEFRFGLEKLDPMTLNILPDNQNQLILKVSSDAPGFEGVNAASSARCINIVPDGKDHTVYHLEWVAEGESTITLWCGEGTSRKEVAFKVTSKRAIPLEGLTIRLDGTKIEVRNKARNDTTFRFPKVQDEEGWVTEDYYNWDNHLVLEIIGTIPINATLKENEYLTLCDMAGPSSFLTSMQLPRGEGRTTGYHENLANYPDFRWFDIDKLNQIISSGTDRIITRARSYKFYPADIRERRIKLWCLFNNLGKGKGSTSIAAEYRVLNDENNDDLKSDCYGTIYIQTTQY